MAHGDGYHHRLALVGSKDGVVLHAHHLLVRAVHVQRGVTHRVGIDIGSQEERVALHHIDGVVIELHADYLLRDGVELHVDKPAAGHHAHEAEAD